MKKLFLAVSICASILASSPVWAVETVAKIEDSARAQRKIAEAAALSWAKDVARDMQLSADPLARAMADLSLRFWAAQENQEVLTSRLSAAQKDALYSAKTPVPERILYLQAACVGYGNQDALCGDAALADALIADDSKNAFTILLVEALRADAEMQALERDEAEPKITDYDEFAKAQTAKSSARLLPKLLVSNEYHDYAQAFKAPILTAVKRRPPPPEVFASLPIEVSALAAAFAPEEMAAEIVANSLIFSTASNYRQRSVCAAPHNTELKAECARIADLILANPKNSAVSAGFALSQSENHPYSKRISAFGSPSSSLKAFDPINLLTLDWLALRSVLNKAATQGDVAAIPDALAWAELAYAKIPNKSAEVIAAEAKASAERRARVEAELAADTAESAVNLKREAEKTSAAATPKPSGGCSADSDEKVDPTAIEFKN